MSRLSDSGQSPVENSLFVSLVVVVVIVYIGGSSVKVLKARSLIYLGQLMLS